MNDQLPVILESRPWITEDEGKDLSDKIDEMRQWLDEVIAEQEKVGLVGEPVFTQETVGQKLERVAKLHKKITNKKKPKEKKEVNK
jgi:hypothetical protein